VVFEPECVNSIRGESGIDLNAIDAKKQRGAGNNRGGIEGV
jgi:hypothetical protein